MKPLRIAFVSTHPSIRRFRRDGSFVYRCQNLGLALSAMGHQVSLLHLKALFIKNDFDIVVFLRPTRSWIFDHIVRRLRAKGTTLIADVDDLIFDPDCAEFRPSIRNGKTNENEIRQNFALNAEAMSMMDKVLFSTPELAKRYKAIHSEAQCHIIPNAGFRSWKAITPKGVGAKNISYLAGTRTHDRDLSIVIPALARLLERHEDLSLRLVGPIGVGFDHPRVKRLERVSFDGYWEIVRDSHILIAPLEDTPFNRCKSAIKAIEGGMMNVPTVVSPVGDYRNIKTLGILHADSTEEWESQLEFALDPVNHQLLRTGLRERMNAFADIDCLAHEFLQFASARSHFEGAENLDILPAAESKLP